MRCNPGQTGPIFISFTDDSEKDNDLSGEIGVNYTPANDRLLYAKIGKGFKGGGWNGGPTLNSFVGPFAFNGWRIYQMPRTYGASVTYRWQ